MDYAAHIARICKIEDIECIFYKGAGRGHRRKRRIKIKPVKTAITYAIALHEIGHVLGPRQTSKHRRLDREVGAWEWAKANAKEWTPAMEYKMQRCLKSYLEWSYRRKGVKLADADHPIHAMAGTV